MDIDPNNYPHQQVYKLFTATAVPRPIAWVSTISPAGRLNLAPFSFFTPVCSKPPTLLFCPGIRAGTGAPKDTYNNLKATGEFVVNFVTEALAEAMNITATELPPDVDEFQRAGLTPAPGKTVSVPHVAETPAYFECRVREIVTISEGVGGGYIVIGTVLLMHYDDSIFREGSYVDLAAFRPIGRLTGAGYCRVTDTFDLERLPPEITPTLPV